MVRSLYFVMHKSILNTELQRISDSNPPAGWPDCHIMKVEKVLFARCTGSKADDDGDLHRF